MGTITGPGVFWWDEFDTIIDPSSLASYPGSGFILNNPLKFKGFSDWTMGEGTTNLVAGSGISKYVKQTSVQQFSQRITQVGSESSDKFTFIFIYRQPQAADYRTIIQWQSNNLAYYVLANGEITMKHQNVDFTTSGLAMTDNAWRHYVYTRSGTAATMYVNGSLFTTFTGLSASSSSATDTKVFDFPGCDGALGQLWFNVGQTITATQVSQHYRAFRRRFGIG